ncbi:MAG: hydantoinase B/oxoprolinase family protein [Alphaproteobacteria bacterium]|jgi:N-methylhydantoinase B|nr:hydantoinase B/oxoprolinase family protein [Alphaproteobacteria bacterium]
MAKAKGETGGLDPVTLEILFNALRSVTDETFIALTKSAYSTNIKERRDHSTAICDPPGRLIVQAENSLPIHLASMTGLMQALLAKFPAGDIREGDLFVANDPHVAGGTHLPDINLAMPVFLEGKLAAFVCNIAHHADVGGMAPGSMAGGMSEIYQEGLRIPVVKLFRKGELQEDLFAVLLLNVRLPEERRGDYYAQIAACRLGARRLLEIAERHSPAELAAAYGEIVSRTERRMRDAVRDITDGKYSFEDVMDDDGLGAVDIPIKLEITVEGERIHFDFAGTSPQVRGNINVTLNATQAAVAYSLKAMLDPEIPNNHGVLDVCEISVEKGSLLHCVAPAPVAARAHTSQRIIDVVLGALSPALPEAAVGAANGANTTAVFSGIDPATGQGYLYLETLGGGFGGRNDRDGTDGVQVHITNTSNLPVEVIESEYPLRVESYGLIEDSGGAGEYRGGMGIRRVIGPVGHTCTFNGAGERFSHRPWGVFGGASGGSGRFLHVRDGGGETELEIKPAGIELAAGEKVVVETPGAGGYGDPKQRSAEAIEHDRASGKFSDEYVKRNYRGDG